MRLATLRSNKEWDKEVFRAEQKIIQRQEAHKMYAEKKLRDGQPFCVAGATIEKEGKEQPAWVIGMFMHGKLFYVVHSLTDRRLKRLKRQAVARLLDISKRGWVETRKYPWLPKRYQNIKNPALVLYGSDSTKDDFETESFKPVPKIFDEDEPLQPETQE